MNRKIAMVLACTALAALVGCSKGNLQKNLEKGTYLGVIAFSSEVNEFNNGNLMLLKPATRYEAESFIDQQRINDKTVLLHAVNTAIDNLEKSPLPADLENISIVTFTDGFDEGSVGAADYKYSSSEEYAAAIEKRLSKDKIGGLHIEAYSIGLRSPIISDIEGFKKNIRNVATSDDKCYMVENFEEVKQTFAEIAGSLRKVSNTQTITLPIPAPDNGKKLRFTFDIDANELKVLTDSLRNATGDQAAAIQQEIQRYVSNSSLYIDAEFAVKNKKTMLTNITYHGIEGIYTEVEGTKSGSEINFTIEGITGTTIDSKKTVEWYGKSSGGWDFSEEFKPGNTPDTKVEEKSAAIYLVIDNSSSLGSDGFETIKAAAKEFIRVLSGAGSNPVN